MHLLCKLKLEIPVNIPYEAELTGHSHLEAAEVDLLECGNTLISYKLFILLIVITGTSKNQELSPSPQI